MTEDLVLEALRRAIQERQPASPLSRVDQCFQCHQTTSWNDIKGTGWYKHH